MPALASSFESDTQPSSVWITSTEAELDFRDRWTATGRRLDMGKACLRFRTVVDLDVDLRREVLGALSVDDYVALSERSRR